MDGAKTGVEGGGSKNLAGATVGRVGRLGMGADERICSKDSVGAHQLEISMSPSEGSGGSRKFRWYLARSEYKSLVYREMSFTRRLCCTRVVWW